MKKTVVVLAFCLMSLPAAWAQAQSGTTGQIAGVPASVSEQEEIYVAVEQMPEFPGGMEAMMKYLSQNTKYPPQALKDSVQGKVFLSFVVTKTGQIRDAQVVKGVRQDLNDEALRVIRNMPAWIPGKQNGKPVNVKYIAPMMFRYN